MPESLEKHSEDIGLEFCHQEALRMKRSIGYALEGWIRDDFFIAEIPFEKYRPSRLFE